jgi:hypothetical protein
MEFYSRTAHFLFYVTLIAGLFFDTSTYVEHMSIFVRDPKYSVLIKQLFF